MQAAAKLSSFCRSYAPVVSRVGKAPLEHHPWIFSPPQGKLQSLRSLDHCHAHSPRPQLPTTIRRSLHPSIFLQQLSLSSPSVLSRPATRLPRRVLSSAPRAQATSTMDSPAAPPATAVDPKLVRLRKLMAAADGGQPIHAFIIPSEDPHMSEYAPECDARRAYISGFDGSAGTAVVTTDVAALWTDGRYFLQAEEQLGPDWTLMKAGTPECPEISEWLAMQLPEGARVGIDPYLHTIEAAEALERDLAAAGKVLVPLTSNPIDATWGADRPAPPKAPIRVHDLRWAGQAVADKLSAMRLGAARYGADALLVTGLDEVAWLLNLRGGDVAYNPVFVSYVLVTPEGATLYVDSDKVSPIVAAHLKEAGVATKAYAAVGADVARLAGSGHKILMDPTRVSLAMKKIAMDAAAGTATADASAVKGARGLRKRIRASDASDVSDAPTARAPKPVIQKPTPVVAAKAIKNDAELEGFKEAHLRDGAALVKFLCWIEKTIASGTVLDEVAVDTKLTGLRAQQQGFIEPSFPTIAGAGPNGAVIHYRAQQETCRPVDANTMLLLDSGWVLHCTMLYALCIIFFPWLTP
jgi:Xaa-Pro aminopeptidase